MFSFSSPHMLSSFRGRPARNCTVSFTGTDGITHGVEVSAVSLYEAAALALAEFRKCGLAEVLPGRVTRLTVSVKAPATSHELTVGKLEDWLASGGRSPKEQMKKGGLKELLG
jgi:hypothetical protein